ncbi:acylphosphatase [soil metagenome]
MGGQDSPPTRSRLVLYGTVQGVGFRDFAQRAARQLGLDGYVRNRRDGAVEVEAEGGADDLDRLRQRLAEGPRFAEVTSMQPLPPTTDPLPRPFTITY